MFDLVRKQIHGIFETNTPAKDQVKKYTKAAKTNWIIILTLLLCMLVVISCQE